MLSSLAILLLLHLPLQCASLLTLSPQSPFTTGTWATSTKDVATTRCITTTLPSLEILLLLHLLFQRISLLALLLALPLACADTLRHHAGTRPVVITSTPSLATFSCFSLADLLLQRMPIGVGLGFGFFIRNRLVVPNPRWRQVADDGGASLVPRRSAITLPRVAIGVGMVVPMVVVRVVTVIGLRCVVGVVACVLSMGDMRVEDVASLPVVVPAASHRRRGVPSLDAISKGRAARAGTERPGHRRHWRHVEPPRLRLWCTGRGWNHRLQRRHCGSPLRGPPPPFFLPNGVTCCDVTPAAMPWLVLLVVVVGSCPPCVAVRVDGRGGGRCGHHEAKLPSPAFLLPQPKASVPLRLTDKNAAAGGRTVRHYSRARHDTTRLCENVGTHWRRVCRSRHGGGARVERECSPSREWFVKGRKTERTHCLGSSKVGTAPLNRHAPHTHGRACPPQQPAAGETQLAQDTSIMRRWQDKTRRFRVKRVSCCSVQCFVGQSGRVERLLDAGEGSKEVTSSTSSVSSQRKQRIHIFQKALTAGFPVVHALAVVLLEQSVCCWSSPCVAVEGTLLPGVGACEVDTCTPGFVGRFNQRGQGSTRKRGLATTQQWVITSWL